MDVLMTILCSVMIVLAVFLVIAVLMQSGKETGLSGTIAGGAETFFGKTKGKTIDRALSKATTVVSIIFVLLVLAVYVLQSKVGTEKKADAQTDSGASSSQSEVVTNEENGEETYTVEESDAANETAEN